ncbi:MAG TPA: hypothetical protein VF132_06820 [Rudaea sp.]
MNIYHLVALTTALSMSAPGTLSIFDRPWTVPDTADWKIEREDGIGVLHLAHPRDALPGPRRPIQFALTEIPRYRTLTVEADVKPLQKSLMIVFAYQDAAHFDYAHLSIDRAENVAVHNGIFHVYGGERVRISAPDGPPAFAQSERWYHAVLTHDATSGAVSVTVDGKPVPALHAVDVSLGAGKIGFGSFDETAQFKNVRITTQ